MLPPEVIPFLEKVIQGKCRSVEFWNQLSGEELTDLLFELSSLLYDSDLNGEKLPLGYTYLTFIYHWESNCQFSGWYAIQNYHDDLPVIIECYSKVGLVDEAKAINLAADKWFESDQDYDAVSEAYSAVDNKYSVDFERLEYLSQYFRDNADTLFYAQDN